jgi:hypothetical protein
MNKLLNILKVSLIGVSFIASALIYILLGYDGANLFIFCFILSMVCTSLCNFIFEPEKKIFFTSIVFTSFTVFFAFTLFVIYRLNKNMIMFDSVNLSAATIFVVLLISLFIIIVYILSFFVKLIFVKNKRF